MSGTGGKDLVVVSDVHIGRDDAELPAFLDFLASLPPTTAILVLLGDIFSLWLGERRYTEAHHGAVLDACRDLRRRGVRVVFIEGNREFSSRGWEGDAFDAVGDAIGATPWAGRHWYLAHGDLVNREDLKSVVFRAVVRSWPVRLFARLIPRRLGFRLAERLERTLRHRNLRHKTSIPPERFERYAQWFAERGYDGGVIGHVHVEMTLELLGADGVSRTLFVLPDWRSTHRSLRIPRDGRPRFETWGPERAALPAVIDVRQTALRATLLFDTDPGLVQGRRVRIDSGHGAPARGAIVAEIDGVEPRRVVVELEPGAPVQVGDRVDARPSGAGP